MLLLGPHHDGLDLGDLLQPQSLQLLHQLPRLLLQRLPGEPPAAAGARPHGAAVSPAACAVAVRRFSVLVNLKSKCKQLLIFILRMTLYFVQCPVGYHGPGLPDGYNQIFRSYVFGPSGFWTMAPLCYATKFDPFLSLDCAGVEGVGAQSKERKGSNFAA